MSVTMSRWLKLLIGLLITLLVAWLWHGPLGRGAAYVDMLQQRADAQLRRLEIPNLQARMSRNPLSRTVFVCGPTNDFQRDGTQVWERGPRDLPGVNGSMILAGGIAAVVWDPPVPANNGQTPPCRPGGPGEGTSAGIPLLVEMFGLALLFWLIGLGIGWLFFRPRPQRTGYLS